MEAAGVIGTIIGLIDGISTLAKRLSEVKEKYRSNTLHTVSVISQLRSIRAALEAIKEWRTNNSDASKPSQQLDEDLKASLSCCAILISVIDAKLGKSGYTSSLKSKIRFLWLEDILEGYILNLGE